MTNVEASDQKPKRLPFPPQDKSTIVGHVAIAIFTGSSRKNNTQSQNEIPEEEWPPFRFLIEGDPEEKKSELPEQKNLKKPKRRVYAKKD